MGGNMQPEGVLLDLYDLQVTGDASPQAGSATEVEVKFKFSQPFYGTFVQPKSWPYTVKVYAEGYGGSWDWTEGSPQERSWTKNGTCTQSSEDFAVKVPVTLNREGVYKLSAIVELDAQAGWVMGYSEKEVQISVWTAV